MLLLSWLRGLHRRFRRSARHSCVRRPARSASFFAAEVQVLERRELLSSVLTDITPVSTAMALEGASTGNVVLATFTDAVPANGTFTPLNPLGSTHSFATAISGNEVVGVYFGATLAWRGFLYNGSTYIDLKPPGAASPNVYGAAIDPTGVSGANVVGTYNDPNLQPHAFLFNGTTYLTLDPSGSTASRAAGVSGNNVVVDASNGIFLYDGSTYTPLNIPLNATPVAISGDNIIGDYTAYDDHGFLYNLTTKTFTTLDVPGGYHTTVTGISGNNVVGEYYVNGSYHRFLYNGSSYNTSIDPPGSAPYYYPGETGTTAIDGNRIVGSFVDPSPTDSGVRHGFLYDGTTYTSIDAPATQSTETVAISGNEITGFYDLDNAGPGYVYSQTFVYELPPIPTDFTASVNWGGAVIGTPAVSVQLLSQSPAGSTWEVIGNATYAQNGNHTVAVTVSDRSGDSVQTSNKTISVDSLDGQYAIATPGANPLATLASVTQNGSQLTLSGSTTTTATITSPTQLLVGASDSATLGNDTIRFGSTGVFANQVWTKLDLPAGFTTPQGSATHVRQNGATLTFIDQFGGTSPGRWINPKQVIATGWNNDLGTVGNGMISWSDGTVWSEKLVLTGAKNGVGTTTITATPSQLVLTDYTGHNGQTAHVVQNNSSTVAFVNERGNIALGTFTSPTRAIVPGWHNDVATFANGRITWSDGSVWTRTTNAAPQITVTDYSNPANGRLAYLVRNNTSAALFINEQGSFVLGTFTSRTRAIVPGWGNDVATFSNGKINWSDGSVWIQATTAAPLITFTDVNGAVSHVKLLTSTSLIGLDGPMRGITGTLQSGTIVWATAATPPITITDFIDAADGLTTHVIQNGTNRLVFINERGSIVLGTFTSPTQAIVPGWNNDVATITSGKITWSDGSIWNRTTISAPQISVTDFVGAGNGRTAHLIQNNSNTVVFVNEQGNFALGTWKSPTQLIVPAWGNDVATFIGGKITWSDGSVWTLGSADIWDNLDANALNALIEMAIG